MYLNRSPPTRKSGGSFKKSGAGGLYATKGNITATGSTTSLLSLSTSSSSSSSTTSSATSPPAFDSVNNNNKNNKNNTAAALGMASSTTNLYSTSSAASLATTAATTSSLIASGLYNPHHSRSKRSKRSTWGARERAGMSFLIVIAFFALFGLIILTELFMIDDKNHSGVVILRHSNLAGRLGDSMPDYENVKEDYDLLDGSLILGDNKLGIFQFRSDNKLKMTDRLAVGIPVAPDLLNGGGNANIGVGGGGGGGGGGGSINSGPSIPWGHLLPTKIEQTLPHYPAGYQPTDGSWQVVNGTRFKFFVFSAYYDRRDGKMVRIIGATKTRGPERVWCRFWYPYKDPSNKVKYFSATVMARVKVIRENWNLKYSACFILCPLRAPGLEIPYAVSVISKLRAPPGNILLVRNTDQDSDFINRTGPAAEQIPEKIAICVKPFHFNYDQALYLLEFLELNSLLGVSHFTFYNHTLGPHVSCILNHYTDGNIPGNLSAIDEYENFNPIGSQRNETTRSKKLESSYTKPTVSILPWNLRMRSQKEIRTEGLFAALNDCLYRNMYRYSHLALIDLDEFIIPRHNDTLTALMSWLTQKYSNRNTGAYSFQNAFFYLQFSDDPLIYGSHSSNAALRAALLTQRKTRRRSKLHPQKQRSKYICRPETVVEAGNHFVWEFVPGKGSLNVPADAGILHHYRVCEFGGDDCIKSPSIIDRTATKYSKRLIERVDNVYKYLQKSCNLPDLPPAPTRPPQIRKKTLRIHNGTNNNNNINSSSSTTKDESKHKPATTIGGDGSNNFKIKLS